MNELRSQFLKEFDFEREAWALRTIRKNIMPHFSNVIIPKPIDHLCNSNVIVMEYVPGKRLLDGIIQNYTRQAIRMGTTLDDLTKGNFTTLQQIKMSSRLAFFYLFDRLQYSATFFWNNSIGLFSNSIRFVYPTLSLNTKSIYSTLLKVQAHQIFNDRIFNGDPHLGNILLTPDGKLGLIDYGQVKSISKKDAREYATLLFLIKDKSKVNELLQVAKSMGFSTEKNDNYVLEKTLRVCLDNDSIEECEGLNLQQFMEKLARQDKTKSIPEQFVFAVRASLLLRGIGHLLGHHNVSLATEWRSYALKAIERYPKGTIDDDVVYDFKKEV